MRQMSWRRRVNVAGIDRLIGHMHYRNLELSQAGIRQMHSEFHRRSY